MMPLTTRGKRVWAASQSRSAQVEAGSRRSLVPVGPSKPKDALAKLNIGVTAYGALSRGLLSGSVPAPKGDLRAGLPRFLAENLARNQRLVATLRQLAVDKRVTPAQLAIAWVLAKGEGIVPLLGARTRAQLEDSLRALDVVLSPADCAQIEEALPPSAVAGTRYDERQMRILDSERDG